MFRYLSLFFALVSLWGCTHSLPGPPEGAPTRMTIVPDKWVTKVSHFPNGPTAIVFGGPPANGPGIKEITVTIKDKNRSRLEKEVLAWLDGNKPSEYLLDHTQITIHPKKGKSYKLEEQDHGFYLGQVKSTGVPSQSFYYLFAKNGKVVEIQGLDDYLRIIYASSKGTLPDLSTLRQAVSVFGLESALGIKDKGDIALGSKAGIGAPFFATIDGFLSAVSLSKDLYKYATRDRTALAMLGAAGDEKNQCMLILTDPGHSAILKSDIAKQQEFEACRKWTSRPLGQPENVQAAKAMAKLTVISLLSARSKDNLALSEQDCKYALNYLEAQKPSARNAQEEKDMEVYQTFIRIFKKKYFGN